MTAALLIFVVSIVVTATAIAVLLWQRLASQPANPFETAASVAVLSFSIAIAINWALSWMGMLSRTALVATALTLAIPSAAFLRRVRPTTALHKRTAEPWLVVILAPLMIWIVFVLWRGAVVPVLSHDALAYHMPKAVMLERAQEYQFFPAPDPRISTSPANYELLLADVLLLTNSDAVTEWVGTASYLTFLLLAAALAERWWGRGPHTVLTALLVAAVPVLLLHSGAHKNDLLANVFYLASILWAARWFATQETSPLVLALTSLACAGGTKLQGAFPAIALMAMFVWLATRGRIRITKRVVAAALISAVAAVFFLGGWVYFANLMHTGQAALPASSTSDAGYGDWRNLWEVPALILLRPFDRTVNDIYIPWRGERWFWPLYELYFSDFGPLISILVLALPFTVWRYRARWRSPERDWQSERILGSVAALLTLLLMLPIRIRPLGFFAGFPRYFVFAPVFVLAWTATPLVKELALRNRSFGMKVIAATSVTLFITTAVLYTANDTFQPIRYVAFVAQNRHFRQPFFANYRGGTVADQFAGPEDTIAVHSGFDSWIYPLYGRTRQRRVTFLDADGSVPADSKYVVIDRAWSIIWGHPDFSNTGQYRRYLVRGRPTDEDLAVFRKLAADPERYELLYHEPMLNQAVFRRRN